MLPHHSLLSRQPVNRSPGRRHGRQGKALINFKTSKPDNVHYSLDCTNGHFSGVAQTALYGKYNILHVGATSNYDHR